MAAEESEGFRVVRDPYGGIIIKTREQTFTNAEEYDAKLTDALPKWEQDGVRGLWVKISLQRADVTAVCAKHGFDFHHAQPGYVMMAKWLSTSEASMIPPYANQYLGVGGFVVNSQNQLLVIQEKYHSGTVKASWKLPGGHADLGETIEQVAQREVLEETGIDTEFISIVSFRHQSSYKHGCSDFYFICLLKPRDETAPLRLCEQEIAAAKWVDVDEYLSDPDTTPANHFFTQCYKDSTLEHKMGIMPTSVLAYNRKRHHPIYSIQPQCDSSVGTPLQTQDGDS